MVLGTRTQIRLLFTLQSPASQNRMRNVSHPTGSVTYWRRHSEACEGTIKVSQLGAVVTDRSLSYDWHHIQQTGGHAADAEQPQQQHAGQRRRRCPPRCPPKKPNAAPRSGTLLVTQLALARPSSMGPRRGGASELVISPSDRKRLRVVATPTASPFPPALDLSRGTLTAHNQLWEPWGAAMLEKALGRALKAVELSLASSHPPAGGRYPGGSPPSSAAGTCVVSLRAAWAYKSTS